jgi:hypothetical protein
VSQAEAVSQSGTPIRVALPADAKAGDTVSSEVTRPDGGKITLSTVLGAADLVQASVSLVIPTTSLNLDGPWSTSTTIIDAAGNVSAPASAGFILDVQIPAAPTAILAPASDTGVLGDGLTRDNTPTLSGSGTPGDSISIRDANGTAIAYAIVQPDGSWSATVPTALPDGLNTLRVVATDPFGNDSTPTLVPIVIDTQAPGIPSAVLASSSDSGIQGDGRTNDATPTIQGTGANPGDTITVTMPGTGEVLTTTVAADGSWSATPLQAIADGTAGTVRVVASDTAGNTSGERRVPLVIDISSPSGLIADLALSSDTGTSGDRITSDSTPTISGTGSPGDTITIKDGGVTLGTAVVAADGSWSITPSTSLSDGTHPLAATATDTAGNTSAPVTLPITIDTLAPTVVVSSVAGDAVDNNSSTPTPADGTFDAAERGVSPSSVTTRPVISGTTDAEIGQSVSITLNGRTVQATVQAGSSGQPNVWSTSLPEADALALNHGNSYSITASVTDRAGNAATDADNKLVANTAAPDVPTVLERYASTLTPTLSGRAFKVDPANASNTIPLASGDTLVVTLEGVRYSLTLGGANTATRLSDNSSVSGGLLAYSAGNWTLAVAPGNLIADGSFNVVVTATAAGSSRSDISSQELHVNRVPPAIALAPVSPDSSARSVVNGLEDDQPLTVHGTTDAEVGATVTLTGLDGIVRTATVLAGASGQPNTFSLVIPGAQVDLFTEGTKTLAASVTNRYGLTNVDTESVLVDTVAPVAPGAVLDPASDSGQQGDSQTKDDTPTFSGTGTAGDTITIRDGAGRIIASALVQSDGTWSATPAQSLSEGVNALLVTATDPAGNAGAAASLSVTIDTQAPAAPTAILSPASDSGVTGDGITNDATPTLSGAGASPGDVITVTMPLTGEILTAVVGANGAWSVTPTQPLPNGAAGNASITATDAAGNVSPATALPLMIDTQAPSAAGISLPEAPGGVNRAEADSNSGTPLVITLPADARVGDTVTTTVTQPGGGTLTLTTVLSASDLPPAQGGQASGSGPFTVTQVIPSSRLSPDGVWSTSTSISDTAGNAGSPAIGAFTLDTAIVTPTASLAPASDTGTAGDNRTSDATPTLSGTGTPGDTITVKDTAGNVIASATVQPNGNWSATPLSALPDGSATLELTATDAAGNISDPVRVPLVIDSTAPAAPVLSSASDNLGPITGPLVSGARTDDATPTLVFTAEAGTTVRIYDGSTLLGAATEGPAGTFTFTPSAALADGLHRLSATASDASGNASGPSISFPLTIDTSAPNTPVLASATDNAGSLTGNLAAGAITDDTTPTLVFTAEAGAVVKVFDGSTLLGVATEGPAGSFSFVPATALAEGSHSFTATATDAAGNTSSPSAALAIVIDASVGSAPVLTLVTDDVGTNTGTLSGGAVTDDSQPTLVLTAEPGALVRIYDGTTLLGAATEGPAGTFTFTPTAPLVEGAHSLTATATDAAGNASGASTAFALTVDASAPASPSLVSATDDVGPVTGSVANGGSTNDTRPTLVFTAEAGSLVKVYDGATLLGTAVEGPAGTYTLTPASPLAQGAHSVTATASDTAGNASAASSAWVITVDTAAPVAPVLTSISDDQGSATGSLASGASTDDATPTLVLTAEAGSTVQIYDGSTLLGSATEGPAGTFTFTPGSALADGAHSFTAVATDAAGNTGPASSAFPHRDRYHRTR